jgi:hypothetical protein
MPMVECVPSEKATRYRSWVPGVVAANFLMSVTCSVSGVSLLPQSTGTRQLGVRDAMASDEVCSALSAAWHFDARAIRK